MLDCFLFLSLFCLSLDFYIRKKKTGSKLRKGICACRSLQWKMLSNGNSVNSCHTQQRTHMHNDFLFHSIKLSIFSRECSKCSGKKIYRNLVKDNMTAKHSGYSRFAFNYLRMRACTRALRRHEVLQHFICTYIYMFFV